jgi:hypothetical protein
MRDNELFTAIRSAVAPIMSARGLPVAVQQAYQPTAQGAPAWYSLTFHVVSERRYGFEGFIDVWNAETEQFDQLQKQQVETIIQVGAMGPQSPPVTVSLADYVRAAASAIQSDAARMELRSAGIGIGRAQNVRITYVIDEKNLHDASPSFDIPVFHFDTVLNQVPAVTAREVLIHRV